MAASIAQRRAAKATKRKRLLKARLASGVLPLADKVRLLAQGKLHCCLMQRALPETGISSVILARDVPNGQIAMAAFLVDAFALGIKDVMFDVVEPSDFQSHLALLAIGASLVEVEPSYARKLLRDAASYAASLGLRPHRGFAAIEQLFGDVRADDCRESFTFGCEGRPLYVVGPSETPRQIVRRLDRLEERLGPEGFEVAIPGVDELVDQESG